MLKEKAYSAELPDLRDYSLPFASEANSFEYERALQRKAKTRSFRTFVFCVPVYNYDISALAKNVIGIVGDSYLEDANGGFICAAGAQSSYRLLMPFANSLMLDFQVWIAPRFVYLLSSDWHNGELKNVQVKERILGLLETLTLATS